MVDISTITENSENLLQFRSDLNLLDAYYRQILLKDGGWTNATWYRKIRSKRFSNIEKRFHIDAVDSVIEWFLNKYEGCFADMNAVSQQPYGLEFHYKDDLIDYTNSVLRNIPFNLRMLMLTEFKCTNATFYKKFEAVNLSPKERELILGTVLWMLSQIVSNNVECRKFIGYELSINHKWPTYSVPVYEMPPRSAKGGKAAGIWSRRRPDIRPAAQSKRNKNLDS